MTSPALKEIAAEMRKADEAIRVCLGHPTVDHIAWIVKLQEKLFAWADEIERAASLTAEQREAIENVMRHSLADTRTHEILRTLLEGPTHE